MNNLIKTTLQTFFSGILVLCLAACCFTKPIDRSFGRAIAPVFVPENKRSLEHPDHFLGCRVAINEQSTSDKARIQKILNNIEHSQQDVVLYFHGGLSGQDYMIDNLGKKLMTSMFLQNQVKKKIYPIFLSYDAHPLDTLPEVGADQSWGKFKEKAEDLLSNTLYKDFELEIKTSFGYRTVDNKDIENNEEELAANAFNMVFAASGKSQRKSLNDYQLNEAQREYFEAILTENKIPDDIIIAANKAKALSLAPSDLDKLAVSLNQVTAEKSLQKSDFKNKSLDQKTLQSKLRILRMLARFVLKIDHGFFATIQEEILEELKVAALGKAHWDKVKDHAKQCFAEGRLGRYLIDELIKLQKIRPFNINTLSHSAGSIATAELIHYLGKQDKSSLNAVVMLVPAINQAVFTEFVVPNAHVYKKLELYSLTKKMEREDKVWKSALYSSSLLYAVSSLAESSPVLDNMLLIDQHMQPNIFPYNKKAYRCVVGEKPTALWQSIKPQQADSAFITYPFSGQPAPQAKAATHEGTKYPWLSDDLSRRYLKTFGVEGSHDLSFAVPVKSKSK